MSAAPVTREQFEALVAEVAVLRADNARLLAENAALKAEVADLKAQLAAATKTPRNSSKPPSTEHPHAKPAAKPKVSNGKRGGQPGHERHVRELVPVEQCTTVVDHKPQACRGCGARLRGVDPAPERKQVWDIPPIVPEITEHRLHRLTCAGCGKVTRAALPDGQADLRGRAATARARGAAQGWFPLRQTEGRAVRAGSSQCSLLAGLAGQAAKRRHGRAASGV